MSFRFNKDFFNLIKNGYEFNSTDTVCKKCGSNTFIMKRQDTVLGVQASITCKKCKNVIESRFRSCDEK